MYCGCARTSLDMDRILDFDCYSLGGHNILRDVTTGAYFLSVTETKLHLIPFFIEGVVQRSECTVAVQGRL